MWNRDGKISNVIFSLFNVLYISSRKGCIDKHIIILLGVQVFYKSSLGALNPNYRAAGFASRAQQPEQISLFLNCLAQGDREWSGSMVQFSLCHIQPVIIKLKENESKEWKRGMTHLQCFL